MVRSPVEVITEGTGGDGDDVTAENDEGAGYEEDDEYDTADEGDSFEDLGAVRDAPPPLYMPEHDTPHISSGIASDLVWAKYNTDAAAYSLIRFSTGQILEDDYSLGWYELAPFELLELYAHLPVQHLPPSFGRTPSGPSTSTQHPAKHRRTASSYSTSNGRHDSHAGHSNSVSTLARGPPPRVYLPRLNRGSLATYVLPYWEGYVRALRVVWYAQEAIIRNFANPPGYEGKRVEPAGPQKTAKLEWRIRWMVVREDSLILYKDREVCLYNLRPLLSVPV